MKTLTGDELIAKLQALPPEVRALRVLVVGELPWGASEDETPPVSFVTDAGAAEVDDPEELFDPPLGTCLVLLTDS